MQKVITKHQQITWYNDYDMPILLFVYQEAGLLTERGRRACKARGMHHKRQSLSKEI
jgi:hypothetical protein